MGVKVPEAAADLGVPGAEANREISDKGVDGRVPTTEAGTRRWWGAENHERIRWTNLSFFAHSRRKPTVTTKRIILAVKSRDSIQILLCFHVVFLMSLKLNPARNFFSVRQ